MTSRLGNFFNRSKPSDIEDLTKSLDNINVASNYGLDSNGYVNYQQYSSPYKGVQDNYIPKVPPMNLFNGNNTNINDNGATSNSNNYSNYNNYNNTDKENITPLPSPTKTPANGLYNVLGQPNITNQAQFNQPPPEPYNPPNRLNKDFYQKANNQKTKRVVTVCQMYFLDYYCDMFDYVISRRERAKQVNVQLSQFSESEREVQWKDYVGRERALLRKRRLKPKHKDFTMITQVGQGGYGQVYLARKKDTREICALKVLNKRLLMKLDETRHVLTERDILTNTRSEWLVKLLYAFQDPENVYLAMEFVPGGDYRTLLNNTGTLIPPHARFYISQMFAAVNALHELGYTHRDLKPENFLIDSKGHIKLTDFGLAAGSVSTDRIESMRLRLAAVKDLEYKVPNRSITERQNLYRNLRQKDVRLANSIVGSPDYMALEVLEGKSYDFTIDYWSLGCMLFETIVGYPPFSGGTPDETYTNLRRWKEALKRPRYEDGKYVFSDRTWQLIVKLIASPTLRLKNFKQVTSMSYFSDIDWENLRSRTPPFTPQLDNEEDAGYFDDFENESDMEKYKDVILKRQQVERLADRTNGENKNFIGFTFKHKLSPNNNASNILAPIENNVPGVALNPLSTLY